MTVMASSDNKAEKKCTSPEKAFSMWKVLLPVAIGLVVVVLMFWHDAKGENLAQVWRGVRFTPLAVVLYLLCHSLHGDTRFRSDLAVPCSHRS